MRIFSVLLFFCYNLLVVLILFSVMHVLLFFFILQIAVFFFSVTSYCCLPIDLLLLLLCFVVVYQYIDLL